METWIAGDWSRLPWVVLSTTIVYAAILLFTRVVGLRSLSKMSAADFVMTVAVGSLLASTASSPSPSLIVGLTALAILYAGQWTLAWARRHSTTVVSIVDNQPLLLMAGSRILDNNLERANVTRADLFGKLREANALNYDQVLAVVFEVTGDISVLHSADKSVKLDQDFLDSVIGADQLFENVAISEKDMGTL